ncbi:MAG: sigma-70 family RNA polymerase sigma factor [Polyangiaceae bacterium]
MRSSSAIDQSSEEDAPLVTPVATGLSAEELVRTYFDFVWRLLRRFGLNPGDADDVAQQVFVVACRKLSVIHAGRERAYLFGVASRSAARFRRDQARRGELELGEDVPLDVPSPEALVDQRRARELLDHVLALMPLELRCVFVSFEIEELSLSEIAEGLSIPRGTAASRLRRAREDFEQRVKRAELARDHGIRGGRDD